MNTDEFIQKVADERKVVINLQKGECDDRAIRILEEMKEQNVAGIEMLKIFFTEVCSFKERLTKLEKQLQNIEGEKNEQ